MPKNKHRSFVRRTNPQLRPPKLYPVYAHEDVLGHMPLWLVPKETRDVWMEQGAVESINHGTALRLKLNLPPSTQCSASMGPGIIEGFADGKVYARSCAAMYGGRDRRDGLKAA